ncbi:MAG: hypothetical protein ACW98D_14935 [Promethearchaeota archaeon]|jgi:DNA-directed RNA polymerase subunit RPC12/RpoP
MSPRYKCKDCGFTWNDIEVDEDESNYFLRCLRCESRNISFPKKHNKANFVKKLILSILFCIATGIIGACIGYVVCTVVQVNNCEFIALIAFVMGFLIPFLIILGAGGFQISQKV